MDILRAAFGILVLLGIAYALSADRKAIKWKLVATGVVLQFIFAISILYIPWVRIAFQWISERFVDILNFSKSGAEFLFSGLVSDTETFGFIFAFQVLPTIVFFSALSSFLYYLGILQRIVYLFAWVMSKTMQLSGAESLSAAGNIFLGQTEAPLLVRPYLDKMSKSEIMTLMTGGMATIAGGVFAAYIGFLGGEDIEQQKLFAAHLLSASIMSAPAAIVAAKMLFPETNPDINRNIIIPKEKIGANFLDAISIGTTDGLKLAVNVGAMLLTFTAFMYMFNYMFEEWIGVWTGLNEVIAEKTDGRYSGLTLQYLLGMIFSPMAWVLGVASEDMV
ncbi:MAG: nucleoside transporter C-terminal domain-containing protein, partial [Chitinophagales bacterium]